MKKRDVDIAIIGTGTAGMAAYREARQFTDSIALIEAGEYGTTCARVGCMPSKLLIAPAEARHATKRFASFGLIGDMPNVDGKAVMQRVRSERDRFVGFVQEAVEDFDSEHKMQGFASFQDDHTLVLDNGNMIQAKRVVIATGSSPHIPDMFQSAKDHLITSDDVFDWENLPESVAVFGAGVIGLELGQALHRLGVEVTIFGRGGRVGPISDPDINQYATDTFASEYPLLVDAEVEHIESIENKVAVTFKPHSKGKEETKYFDYLLATTGRKANVEGLGLENTSLALDARGIPVYHPQTMQCGESSIFMAGDVASDIPLLHEAADEGRLAGENAARYPNVFARARKTVLSVVFTDPQMAVVGQSYKDLTEASVDFAIGEVSFEDQGRSRVMLVNQGLMHLYGCKKSGCLLGAEMVGPHHEHLAHLLAWCIQMNKSVKEILEMPFYHPVIEEGLRTGLRDLLKTMGFGGQPPLRSIDCGPGA